MKTPPRVEPSTSTVGPPAASAGMKEGRGEAIRKGLKAKNPRSLLNQLFEPAFLADLLLICYQISTEQILIQSYMRGK